MNFHHRSYLTHIRWLLCHRRNTWFILVISGLQFISLNGQNFEFGAGQFSHENHPPESYQGHYQNWAMIVDQIGFVYSANGDGILEYDGENWRLITKPGLRAVRRIVVDENNVKWVGADRDLGYLKPDSTGFLQFNSLKAAIPESKPLDGNIWKVFPREDDVLFFTDSTIYKWHDHQFTVIPCEGGIHREFMVNGKIYLRRAGLGLFTLDPDDGIRLTPNGSMFKDLPVHVLLPYQGDTLLVGSEPMGLYLYDGKNLTKFDNQLDQFLDDNILYSGIMMADSNYAFATLLNGVVMMDRQGNLIKHITTRDGILNNQVHGFAMDQQGAIWLALQTGMSKIEPNLPYLVLNENTGLQGTVAAITYHQESLFVATYNGLYKLGVRSDPNSKEFQKVEQINSGCFALLSTPQGLLAATADGTFLIRDDEVTQLNRLRGCRNFYRSKSDSSRVFLGHMGGLASLYLDQKVWKHGRDHPEIVEDIFSVVEGSPGEFWLGTSLHQVIRIKVRDLEQQGMVLNLDHAEIDHFHEEHGIPVGVTNVFYIDDALYIASSGDGGPLLKFDTSTGSFVKDTAFGSKFGIDSLTVYPIDYQDDGRYILLRTAPQHGASYEYSVARVGETDSLVVKRVFNERFRSPTETTTFWDENNQIWTGGEATVVSYDLSVESDNSDAFQTNIRKVLVGQDSVIFGGTDLNFQTSLPYHRNELRFEFAALSFDGLNNSQYQYFLKGYESDWSEWTSENKKDYTNLREGDYEFLVRARNIYGTISESDAFGFSVLPPWFRSWWAYLTYVSGFIGLIWLVVGWRARTLKSEKEALEKVVLQRTQEVQAQSLQLKDQADRLKEMDRVKSRFFANISHEFRTPLTLILGPLQDYLNRAEQFDDKEINIMHRSALRLQKLINQLLDLSKIESGKLVLAVSEGNLSQLIRAILGSFSSLAVQRKIEFDYSVPDFSSTTYYDEDIIEKIINNLVSNALKFTPDCGKVNVEVLDENETIILKVKDTGPGIPEEQLETIFDRFTQLDSSSTREQQGTGIGLALTKELANLCHGSISVESVIGHGSIFTISIPVSKESFQASELDTRRSLKTAETKLDLASNDERIPVPGVTEGDQPLVLIVEDQSELRYYIGKHLSEFRQLEAPNGVEGLATAVRYVPDLIISDIMMPKMDGIEFLQQVKADEKTSHIPVILLTAKADLPSKLEGLETGADDYLTKPFNANELVTRCNNLINQRKLLRKRFSKTLMLEPKEIAITSADEIFLEKVMKTINKHLDNAEFSVETFQREVGMSRMQLHRKLKALTDHSATEFVRVQRLKRASQLLKDSDTTISEVCYRVGFNSLSYFTKCFKEQFGVTPSEHANMPKTQVRP